MWSTNFSRLIFFLSTIIERNKLEWRIRNCKNIESFKKRTLSFIRPSPNITFNCHNLKGIKPLSRLRLGQSHLREHKFKHSFQDPLSLFCNCGKGKVKISSHDLLHCSNYLEERLALQNTIRNINMSILQQSDSKFTSVLLFGNASFNSNKNIFNLPCHYRLHYFDRSIWWTFVQKFLTPFCKHSIVNKILYSI